MNFLIRKKADLEEVTMKLQRIAATSRTSRAYIKVFLKNGLSLSDRLDDDIRIVQHPLCSSGTIIVNERHEK